MPAISIVIATYNCARYLPASLDSILDQTEDGVEILVVDDGSTDDTPAVLSRYAGRIVSIRAEHGGYAAARSVGLGRATGEWVSFHDADDVALPDRLAFQLDFLRRNPSWDGVLCDGERMEDGERLVPLELRRRCAGARVTVQHLFAGFPLYFQASLIRRRTFDAVGPFDPAFRIHADMEYGYRLLPRARLVFVDRVVFRYRSHEGGVTRDRLEGREEIARILDRVCAEAGDAAQTIGVRRLRARLALHYYRIARRRLGLGQAEAGRRALRRAIALRPLDPRYRLLRLWHAA
jgi:glycosyltransferase involved in cell wall biosynthesis